MKRRKAKLIFSLLTLFALCSCSANNCKEFTLMEGDIILINRENYENEAYKSNNESTIECLEENFIKANQEGETSVILTYDEKKEEELVFQVKPREIKDINEKQNEEVEQDLVSKIGAFVAETEKKEQLSIDVRTYASIKDNEGKELNSSADSIVIKSTINPFQIEYGDPEEKDFVVIKKENGQFYLYNKRYTDKLFRHPYAINDEEFEKLYESSDYYYDIDGLMDFNFDKLNSNTYSKDNFYLIHSYYKDSLSDELKNEIVDLYRALGLDANALLESIVTVYYQFEENTVTFGVALNIEINNIKLEMGVAFIVSTQEFEPYKLTDENALLPKPHNINLVTEKTDFVGKEFQFSSYDDSVPECIMTDFKKGQYIIYSVEGTFNYLDIRIYNKNKELVDTSYVGTHDYTFYIPKDGTYYVELSRSTNDLIKLKVEKANYETTASLDKPEELISGEYVIEGYMDIHYFEYNNTTNQDKILTVKNVGSETFMFSQELVDHIYSGASFRYTLKPGINKFVLSYNIFEMSTEGYPKTYNVEFEIS